MATLTAATLILTLTASSPTPVQLDVDLAHDGAVAMGAIATTLVMTSLHEELASSSCRWCEPPQFDTWMRDQLLWADPDAARLASNIAIVAVPVGLAGALALSGRHGPRRNILEDFILVAQAYGITTLGDQVSKLATARLRPYAFHGAPTGDADDRLSFWSGHTSQAFSVAASAGTVARLRGYRHWRWIMGLGFAGATATAYFRVAGDRHWTTDALAGAAWGTAVGVAVPLLHVKRDRRATLVPTGTGALLVIAL